MHSIVESPTNAKTISSSILYLPLRISISHIRSTVSLSRSAYNGSVKTRSDIHKAIGVLCTSNLPW